MSDLETRLSAEVAPKWRVRRVTADIGNGRELVACSDGSWRLDSESRDSVHSGQVWQGGLEAAKRAATDAARAMGWL